MQALITVLRQDPLFAYSVAAALVLLTAALTAGFSRLDFIAVLHPHGLLAIVSAVLASLVLMVFIVWLERSLLRLPWLWLDSLPESAFPLVGAWRLPLYIVALAYGPSAGLASAALIVAFSAQTGLPGWQEGLLAFELVTVGWLAIAPNPRKHPWAGTFNILLAHLLTLMTLGLALLRWQQRPLTLADLWQLSGEVSGGVLVSALVVAYVTPAFYARVFATSRIATRTEHAPHMPLPPLTAPLAAARKAKAQSEPASKLSANHPQPAIPAATPSHAEKQTAMAADATSKHDFEELEVSKSSQNDEQPARVTKPLATRASANKRPSERQLSMPTFFDVDAVEIDSFEVDSFEVDSFEVDDLEVDK
jgi:hypothetical protein